MRNDIRNICLNFIHIGYECIDFSCIVEINLLTGHSSCNTLKIGYIEFAWLESSADATPAVMLSPAVAMAAEVHCQRQSVGAQWLAEYLHDASRWLVITQR